MKASVPVAVLCVLTIAVHLFALLLQGQEPATAIAGEKGIVGHWTQIYYESHGNFFSSVANEKLLMSPVRPDSLSRSWVPLFCLSRIWKNARFGLA